MNRHLPQSFYRDPEGYAAFLGQEQDRLESQVRLLRARGGNPKPVQQRLALVYSQLDAIRAKQQTGFGDPTKEYQASSREAELRARKDEVEAALKSGHPDEKRLRKELSNIYGSLKKLNSYQLDKGVRDNFKAPPSDPNSPKSSPSNAKYNGRQTGKRTAPAQQEPENFLESAVKGTIGFFRDTLIPGAAQELNRTREDINTGASIIAKGVQAKYPDGFLKLDWLKELGKHDDQALVTYYALKNFEPTQIPKMVQALTEKGVPQALAKQASDAAAKGDASILMELVGGKDLIQKVAAGDRDAFAQVAGNLTSFVIEAGVGGGIAGSGKSIGRMIRKVEVPEPVTAKPRAKDLKAEQFNRSTTANQKAGSEVRTAVSSSFQQAAKKKIVTKKEAASTMRLWDKVGENWAQRNGSTLNDFYATYGPTIKFDERIPAKSLRQADGPDAATTKQLTEGRLYVSPNIEEGLDFDAALKQLESQRQARIKSILEDAIQNAGMEGRVSHGVGDWSDGAEGTLVGRVDNAAEFEDVRYAAAKAGLAADQKDVIAFRVMEGGSNLLWDIKFLGKSYSPTRIRKALDAAGIQFRTIELNRDGAIVSILDLSGEMEPRVRKLASKHPVDVRKLEGEGEFVTGKYGMDGTRVEARALYRRVMEDYEARHNGGHELHRRNAEVGREASPGAPRTGGQLGSPGSIGSRGRSQDPARSTNDAGNLGEGTSREGDSDDSTRDDTLFDSQDDRVKGAVQFTPDERPVVHLFTGKSDISTVLHESAHIWRKTLGEAELSVIDRHFGDPASRGAEEAFARSFERYLRDGLSPDGELDGLFKKFSGYLSRVYSKVKGTAIEEDVPDGIRRVFDKMLGAETDLDPLGLGTARRVPVEVLDDADSNPLWLPRQETLQQPGDSDPASRYSGYEDVFDDAVAAVREGWDSRDIEDLITSRLREKDIDRVAPAMLRDAYESAGQRKVSNADGTVLQIGGETVPAEIIDGIKNWRTVLMPFWRSGIRIVQGLDPSNTKLRDWLVQDRADAVTTYTQQLAEIKKQLKEIEPVVVRKPKLGKAMADLAEGRITREQAVSELGEAMVQRLENATARYRDMYEQILEQLNDVRAQYMDEPEAILPREDMFTHLQEIAKKHEAALGRSVGRTGGVAGDVAEGARSQLGKVDPDAAVTFEAALEPLLSQIHLAEPAIRHRLLAEVLRQAGGELDAQISTRPKGARQVIDAKRTQAKADSHRRVAAALDEMADILEGRGATLDKAAEKLDFPWLQQTVSYLVQQTGKAKIVGNLGSAVMQTLSPALSFPELGFSNVAVGFLKNAAGVMKKADAPMEKSGFLTRRYTDTNTIRPTWSGKAANVLSIPMNLFEETAVRGVWRAAYERGRAGNFIQGGKRMDEAEAIRYADRITEQVVGGRAKGEKPTIFESRVGKTMLQFQIEPNNLVGYFGKSFAYDDVRKLSKPELALKVAKTLAGFYLLNEMTSFLMGREPLPDPVRQAVGGLTDRDEEEGLWQGPAADIVKSKADQKALRVLGQVFLGDVVGAHPLAAPIVGLGREYDVLGTGLDRKQILGDTELGTFAGGGAPWTSTIRGGTGDPLGSIVFDFTLGGSQIKKTIRAIDGMNRDKISRNFDPKRGWWSGQVSKALASGSRDSKAKGGKKRYDVISDPREADFWRAITFGPSATKAAGKYYEKQRRKELKR